MPAFIDESGDPGTKTGEGSTGVFRLALVYLETKELVVALNDRIMEQRGRLNLPRTFEFHFARIGHDYKAAFFAAIADIPYIFFVATVDKSQLSGHAIKPQLITSLAIDGLAGAFHELLLARSVVIPGSHSADRITYDERPDPHYKKDLQLAMRAMRDAEGRQFIKDIKPGQSRSDSGIQLADMVCGAVAAHASGESRHYRAIRDRCGGLIDLPRKEERIRDCQD